MEEKSEFIAYGDKMEILLKDYFRQVVETGKLSYLSKKQIAERLGVDQSTVTRHFKPLEDRGYHFDTVCFFAYCKLAEMSPLEVIGAVLMEYELQRLKPA